MDPKKVGQTIAYLRKQAGFTQKGLADRLCISDKAVSKWERGLSVPDIAYLGKLSVLLDTDIDILLEGKHISRANRWKGFLITEDQNEQISLLTTIYDKPLVYFLLSNFLLAGIREVLIACTEAEKTQLQQLLGTGKSLGISICYGEKKGIHEVISGNQEFFRDCHVMTVFEKSILHGASLTYLFQRAMLNKGQHTILAVPSVEDAGSKQISFDETKRVTGTAAVSTNYSYRGIPVLFSPVELLARDVSQLPQEGRLVEHLAKQGSLYVENANRGIVEVSVSTADDVMDAANLVRILQKRSGAYLACLEEIAWRRGLMDAEMLKAAQNKHLGTEYGNYLHKLSK